MLRPCLGVPGLPDCGRLTDHPGRRCPDCTTAWHQARDATRGTARQRGYDAGHDRTRAALLATLVPGTACPRCGRPMLPSQDLDAGHSTARSRDRRSRADRLEHSHCNRSAGADDGDTPLIA